jgi:elongation factor 1-beta
VRVGKVAVTYRIMPEGSEVDVHGLESSVRGALGGAVRDVAVRPIAFGLNALEATVVVDDAAGQAERIEERIRGIVGVGEVETLGVSLL